MEIRHLCLGQPRCGYADWCRTCSRSLKGDPVRWILQDDPAVSLGCLSTRQRPSLDMVLERAFGAGRILSPEVRDRTRKSPDRSCACNAGADRDERLARLPADHGI